MEEVLFDSLKYYRSLIFLSIFKNHSNRLPMLLKPDSPPPRAKMTMVLFELEPRQRHTTYPVPTCQCSVLVATSGD
jgi:hypothetical protein